MGPQCYLFEVAESGVTIKPVEGGEAERLFLDFPYHHYRHDSNWVAPLRIDQKKLFDCRRHPFWRRASMQRFLAFRQGAVCGRIAAIHDTLDTTGMGTFGFFESQEDGAVARGLLDAAGEWLAAAGRRAIRGPMNPSINYECGLLVEGFDSPPRLMMTYNPPFYASLLEAAGFRKAQDLYAYRMREPSAGRGAALERARRLKPLAGMQIRSVRLNDYERELEHVWRIYSSAWDGNWGATPFTKEEMLFQGRELRPLLVPEWSLLAEVEGVPVGFGLMIPDWNQALQRAKGSLWPTGLARMLWERRRIRHARVITLGVVQEYRNSSIAAHLYAGLIEGGLRKGFVEAECSWVAEENRTMNRSLAFLGAERYKTYRIYEKRLLA